MFPVVMPTYARANIAFERGQGPYLWSTEGRRYLDFGAGVAVNSLGHCHPKLVAALQEQAGRLWHTSNLYRVAGQERVAAKLTELTFADSVFFCNSGAEASECCIKMVRKYFDDNGQPDRYRIICAIGGFHGRTLATIAAGGQQKHLAGFDPVMDGFDHVPYGDLEAMKAAIGPNTAAILVEPVQGEGGILPADPKYLQGLRALADANGLLLVFDEVQTGMGRTGALFAHQAAGVEPDIMAAAKGLGGGFPLGACLAKEKAARALTYGSHGSTFGGNPLAMAVAEAVIDVIADPVFLAEVKRLGHKLKAGLTEVCERFPQAVETVRGKGLMLGIKCKLPNTTVNERLLANGLLVVGAGDNVVRMIPPLIISDAHIDEALGILANTLTELTS